MEWLTAKTLRALLWLKVRWSLSRKLLLRINWRIVEISMQVLYFSISLMMWSFASLSDGASLGLLEGSNDVL